MNRSLNILIQIPPVLLAMLFTAIGAAWLFVPASGARAFGFELPTDGPILSATIGTSAAFSLTIAMCLIIGIWRKAGIWYYAAAMLYFFVGIGRVAAGALHGAPHVPERYLVEFAFAALLVLAARNGIVSRDKIAVGALN